MNIFQKLYHKDLTKVYKRFDGIILDNVIGDIPDLQTYFEDLRANISAKDKILISYHNPAWEPILTLASKLGFRKKVGIQNWLEPEDIANILNITGFEVISTQKRFFGITTITTAKPNPPSPRLRKDKYSVSIIIPARNEEGNIKKIIPAIPKFGKWQEIIFVEGNSTDKTWRIINKQISKSANKQIRIRSFKQKGKGKADAVRLGFEKAKGDILIIYDADMTVPTSDLPKFYNALAGGTGEFINGDRLTYPMEGQAMQMLNKFGNHIFGIIFTKIFGQHFKDTLCGTKALWRNDFNKYKKDYDKYLKIDPFGDFALIFTAIRHTLKVVEIPIRYRQRTYGSTNISRFKHSLMLFKMAFIAFLEFKT